MLIGIDANEANLTKSRVGVNQYAFDLLWALYNTKSSHSFCIYLKSQVLPDLPPVKPNWKYRIIPFFKLWTQTRLPFDLYIHYPRPDVFLSLTHYAPRFCPMPSVVTVMDIGFLNTPHQFTPKDYNQLKNWTWYSVRQAKKVIAISNFTRQDLLKNYSFLDPQDVVVSYPSYDSQLFIPTTNAQVLKKYSITKPYILFLSSLKPSKNVEGLILGFHKLLKTPGGKYSHLQLVIAGKKAWLYDQIFLKVKQLGLQSKVIFTDFIPEHETPVLMTESLAFALPSFHEGFGIPVLEAMACGAPVVVSNIASLPEVAGKAGIYVNPHDIDSISQGLRTATGSKRNQYIQNGFRQVKLFNWTKTATETLAVLQSAL